MDKRSLFAHATGEARRCVSQASVCTASVLASSAREQAPACVWVGCRGCASRRSPRTGVRRRCCAASAAGRACAVACLSRHAFGHVQHPAPPSHSICARIHPLRFHLSTFPLPLARPVVSDGCVKDRHALRVACGLCPGCIFQRVDVYRAGFVDSAWGRRLSRHPPGDTPELNGAFWNPLTCAGGALLV